MDNLEHETQHSQDELPHPPRDKLVSHVMDELSQCRGRMHKMETTIDGLKGLFGDALKELSERLRKVESRAGSTEANFNAFSKYFHNEFEPALQNKFDAIMGKIGAMHDTVSFVAENRTKARVIVSFSKWIGSVVVWSMKWSLICGAWFTGISIMWHTMINNMVAHYPWLSKWRLW